MALYLVQNGPMQTTAAFAKVATGNVIKTMLQIQPGATNPLKIKAWGASMDAIAAATPPVVELIETDVAATVTAFVATGITKIDAAAIAAGDPTTSMFTVGTAASGYTATAEGTITAVRNLAASELISPTNQFIQHFTLGDEPLIQLAKFARIRVTAPATVNMICWMLLEA